MYGLNVRLKGPIVEGRSRFATQRLTMIALSEVAEYAKFEVLRGLDRSLKHPTGYYESRIRAQRRGMGVISVNDHGVIYGPWLEGVSSRNETTTFKGYENFRLARNRMARKTTAVANAAVARHLGELG